MHNLKINDTLQVIKNNLTAKQRDNWRKLIDFMKKEDKKYDHHQFNDEGNHVNACALSYAISAGIIKGVDDYFSQYFNICDDAFGFGSHKHIFGGGDTEIVEDDMNFYSFCYYYLGEKHITRDFDDGEVVYSADVARALEALIFGINTAENVTKVVVHWKNNVKDTFSSIDAFREFVELNPHRQNAYRKIVATRKVERIVYDEVEEVITL